MSDLEPIQFRPRGGRTLTSDAAVSGAPSAHVARFDKRELNDILTLYGRKVAAGEWRDYALDMGKDKATFAVYRRASEYPIYRIEKNPKLARKQGAYAVIAATGLILKRGNDLKRVLEVLEKTVRVVG